MVVLRAMSAVSVDVSKGARHQPGFWPYGKLNKAIAAWVPAHLLLSQKVLEKLASNTLRLLPQNTQWEIESYGLFPTAQEENAQL